MASAFLRRSTHSILRNVQSSSYRLLPKQPTRLVSGQAGGSSNTVLYTGLGLTLIGGFVVYRQLRKPAAVLSDLKKEGYQESKSVHPEAEAEAQASTSGAPSTTTQQTQTPAEEKTDQKEVTESVAETAPKDGIDIPNHVTYVLIGAGTASYSCANAIRSRDPKAKILIIGEEEYPPYMRPPLSKALWLEEDHEQAKKLKFKATWAGNKYIDVFYKGTYVDVKDLASPEDGGTAVLTGHKVVQLSTSDKELTLNNGAKVKYDKCLIATGGVPKNLPVFTQAGDDVQKNISVFRKIPDFLDLDAMVSSKKSVLVVGGGFLGSELAVAMAARGKPHNFEVYQVFLESGNLGLVLPKMLSDWAMEQVRNEGVKVFPNNTVEKVSMTEDGRVCATTKDGQELKVDHILVAVGINPETSLAASAGLEEDSVLGGYRVNSELQACTDLWVAGDVSCFYDPHLGRRRVEHHDHANVSGKLAGENMTGAGKPFTHQSMFWSDVGPKVGFEAVGLIDSSLPTVGIWAKTKEQEGDEPKDDFSKGVVFYTKEGVIVGVLTWNIFGKMNLAREAIAGRKLERDIPEVVKEFNIH